MQLINNNNISSPNDNNSFLIKNNEYILLQPGERKTICLSYKKTFNKNEFIIFELDLNLAKSGLTVTWTNLNEESSTENIYFLIQNNNKDDRETNILSNLVGSNNKIVIKPNSILGKLFVINKI